MQLATRTGQQQEVEIYSLSTEEHDLAYAPMIALVNESIPTENTDPRTGGAITEAELSMVILHLEIDI